MLFRFLHISWWSRPSSIIFVLSVFFHSNRHCYIDFGSMHFLVFLQHLFLEKLNRMYLLFICQNNGSVVILALCHKQKLSFFKSNNFGFRDVISFPDFVSSHRELQGGSNLLIHSSRSESAASGHSSSRSQLSWPFFLMLKKFDCELRRQKTL